MITASIVTYNTKIEELQCVLRCALGSIIEHIWVIDNSPEDTISKFVVDNQIEYIHNESNIGYGSAHNIAIQRARQRESKYHVILNSDIIFEPSIINSLSKFMDSHMDVGDVMPKVYYPSGELQYLAKLLPTPIDIFARKFIPKCLTKARSYRFEMRATGYNKAMNVPLLSGCFMFLRMSVLDKVGLFDDRFFMYFEDFDLIRRINREYKTVFYPYVSIVHNHASEHKTSGRLFWISLQSAIKYFNKWGWFFDSERRQTNKHAFSPRSIIAD